MPIFDTNFPFVELNVETAIFLPFGATATLLTVSADEYQVYIFLPLFE